MYSILHMLILYEVRYFRSHDIIGETYSTKINCFILDMAKTYGILNFVLLLYYLYFV